MPQPSALLAWLALHFLIGLSGTWLARRYALRRRLLDLPDARRSHAVPTPRGGGIAIVAAALVAMAVTGSRLEALREAMALQGLGLALVAGVGWLDDHRPLPAWPRLAVHGLAAALLALAMVRGGAPAALAAAGLVAAVALVNAWNFLDGIDGLVASQAALAAAGLALFAGAGPVWWIGLALAAAACGFLPFNLPRARIFLGDVGSGAIGYLLAVLLAGTWMATPAIEGRLLALLPLTVCLADTGLTLVARLIGRERWWTAHVQHLYQRLARRLGRHGPVTAVYAAVTAIMVVCALVTRFMPAPFIIVTVLTCWLAVLAAWLRLRSFPQSPEPAPDRTKAKD